jgi:hypothetical protein
MFTKKVTVQNLLRMYAGQPATLVIVDQEVDGAGLSNFDGKRAALLKQLAGKPGKAVSPELARREAAANLKLRSEPEVFLVGFRVVPKWFQGFVDPLGPDVYPEAMWSKLAVYFHHLISDNLMNGENCWFQGGRYGAAKDLRGRQLPFLEGLSLGELSHIVQLALTNEQGGGRGLLSYQPDKTIAPRSLSQRHRLADLGLPVGEGPQRRVGQGCANDDERWAELRHVLRVVLSDHPEGRSLALLKVDIERRFGMILDQSVFREVKLSHVFESLELRNLFEVRRASQAGGASQVIVYLKDFPSTPASQGLPLSQGPISSISPPVSTPPAVTVPPPVHRIPTTNLVNQAPTLLRAARPVPGNFPAKQQCQVKFGVCGQYEEKRNLLGLQCQAPQGDRRLEPAKVGLSPSIRGVIEPPPGLSSVTTEGEAADCCPPGFMLAQGFSNGPPMEDFATRDTGREFFGPGLELAEDLLEGDSLFKDVGLFNNYSRKQVPVKSYSPYFNTEAQYQEKQSPGRIWGNDSLSYLPFGVTCA